MRPLIELCLRQRRVVIGLCLVLSIVAGILTRNAPFDAFPEFAPPRVEIQTEAAGLSSEEVETLVTMPLEAVLAGTSGLKEMRSRSVLGLSSVVLILQRDTDVVRTRALISERLARATLPAVAGRPILLSPRSSTSRVLKIAVSSRELSQMELTDLIRWVVRPRLISVPGVANVALWGAKTRQLQVQVDPTRLQAHELTLDRVIAATQGAVSPAAGGFIDGANQRLPILHRSFIETPEDLAQVPVDPSRARALTLGDVANITSGQAPPIGEAVVTSGPGLLLVIEKEPGGNTLEITQSIDQELEDLLPGLPNVDIDATVFRPAGFIRRALLNLAEAMAIGTVLVVLILLLFLWDWRTALISIVAIPLSLLTASAVLALLGQTLDTMVVAGLIIALGEVVDDSIIDVENIHRRLREATRKGSTTDSLKIVLQASLEVRSAVVYATMIVILVFLPVLFIPGVAGEFFRPLAIGYSLSVLASMLVALTLTPALALVLLPGRLAQQKQASVTEKLQNFYRRILKRILRHPLRVVTLGLLLLSASVGTLATLDEVFLPHFSENDFLMHWIGKPGSSLSAMARTSNRVRKELLAIPGVRNFGAHIGRAEAADEVVGPNFAELWISVDPEAEQPATLQAVHDVVAGYPGIYNDVQTYLQERMREVLMGGPARLWSAYWVRIYVP